MANNSLTVNGMQPASDLTPRLEATQRELDDEKTKNAAKLEKQKEEANKYATGSRLGQITITTGEPGPVPH